MAKGLSISIIFKANSLNYGEGVGNISELKKIHRANGDVLTFASRQAIRYDMVRLGNEWFDWNLDVVDKEKGTIQFREEATIEDSVEMDLFGYLKTGNPSKKRPAVVRLSHAVSMEPYRADLEFMNNLGLAERIGENANLVNVEQHKSYYTYTVTIDLDKVGKDGDIELTNEEKATRVLELLEIVKFLNRNIRGRQENLSPLFVIGGIYDIANPFFLGRLEFKPKTWDLNTNILEGVVENKFMGTNLKEHTYIGYIPGVFGNEKDFSKLLGDNVGSIEDYFSRLREQVIEHYGAEL